MLSTIAASMFVAAMMLLFSAWLGTESSSAATEQARTTERSVAASAANPCDHRKRYSIYYATTAFANSFYVPIKKGAENGARDYCLRMTWTQSASKYNLADTVRRIKSGIAAKPDVLVVSMKDAQVQDAAVRDAIKAGIAVINITEADRRTSVTQPDYLTYIGTTSDYATGTAAARAVLAAKKPSLAVVANPYPKTTSMLGRVRGWEFAMNAAGVKTDRIDTSKKASQAIKSYLAAHPEADAIYTVVSGSSGSTAAREAIASVKRSGTISLVSTDYEPSDLKAIKAGTQLAAITQEQYLQGYLAAVVTRLYFERGQVPAFITTGPRAVDSTNVDSVIALQAKGVR